MDAVCAELQRVPELENGFDAIGFSQGGLFLRALVQRCDGVEVRNLMTFGSPHMGLQQFLPCTSADWLCRAAQLAASWGVYTPYAQTHVIQAQYFRDPKRMPEYLHASAFLAQLNGESEPTRIRQHAMTGSSQHFLSQSNGRRLETLQNLILIRFTEEHLIDPPQSTWFGSITTEGRSVNLTEQAIFQSDTIGLRYLWDAQKIHFGSCEGQHMQISDECILPLLDKYIGPSSTTSS